MKILLSCIVVLFFSFNSYAEDKKEIIRLGEVFSSGTIESGKSILQQEEFLMSDTIVNVSSASMENIYFSPLRVYPLPYINYIFIDTGLCTELFYYYFSKGTSQFFIERYIITTSNTSIDFLAYEGIKLIVRYKNREKK